MRLALNFLSFLLAKLSARRSSVSLYSPRILNNGMRDSECPKWNIPHLYLNWPRNNKKELAKCNTDTSSNLGNGSLTSALWWLHLWYLRFFIFTVFSSGKQPFQGGERCVTTGGNSVHSSVDNHTPFSNMSVRKYKTIDKSALNSHPSMKDMRWKGQLC